MCGFLVTISDGMIILMVDWIFNIVWLVGYMAMVSDGLMSFFSGWNGCLLGWSVGWLVGYLVMVSDGLIGGGWVCD